MNIEKEIVLKVENLSKVYRLGEVGTGTISHDLNRWFAKIRGKEDPFSTIGSINDRTKTSKKGEYVKALNDIHFEVRKGDVLGIIGKNGAGKSTLLKVISQITSPTIGSIKAKGRIASLLEVGTGMHPEMTGKENVYLNGTILGMTKREINAKFDEIMEFAGCAKYANTPVKRFSSGMKVRLGFAVAAFLEPEILIVDEVLAVGDADFQKKAIGKMQEISSGGGRTVLFVSHNMGSIQSLCKTSILLENGMMVMQDKTEKTIDYYLSNMNVRSIDSLEEITDRSGNQKIIFSDVYIENSTGNRISTILTGQDIFIVFKLKVNMSVDNVNIGFSIHNYLGDSLSVLYSGYQNNYLTFKNIGYYEVRCLIRNINYSTGRLVIKGRIEENKNEADWPKDVLAQVDVEKGDFFGTGSPGFHGNVPIVIKGEWLKSELNHEGSHI